jgi:phosphatidylethanolamine/phosphatidyl-N-methylethanolamine N-methyltransferase
VIPAQADEAHHRVFGCGMRLGCKGVASVVHPYSATEFCMPLFDRTDNTRDPEVLGSSDAATRALSVTAVETDFVAGVYEKLAVVYDWVFGPTLHAGRLQAFQRMATSPGDRILEVGVGTGINLSLYPRDCNITGIDLSESMLEKAHERVAEKGMRNVRLQQMDASRLTFPDDAFDIVYAPYLISVVPDPVQVALEMRRVCRPGGRIIILNHFRSPNRLMSWGERLLSPFTIHIGFKSDLDLPAFLAQADLHPVSIEKVNIPPIWSLVTCIKD